MQRRFIDKLNKDIILDNISQEEIFSRYFHVPIHTIMECVENGTLINSLVRPDNNASMGFTYNSQGKLKCRDFGGYFWGDCLDAAAFSMRLDVNDNKQFMQILDNIAKDFNIWKYSGGSNLIINVDDTPRKKEIVARKMLKIEVGIRDYNQHDVNYWWNKYSVSSNRLTNHDTYPIKSIWINNKLTWTYTGDNDVCYGYYFGKTDDDIEKWKLYFPNRKENKFIQNTSTFQGINQLKKVDVGIWIKSFKDVICLSIFGETLSLQGVAPNAENIIPNKQQYDYIKGYWNEDFSMTDFDYTGIKFAQDMKRTYGTERILIPRGRGLVDLGVKDLSDFIEKYGIERTYKIIEYVYNNRHNKEAIKLLIFKIKDLK